jgi:transcriptional regulator with XRE-family HTH domain
VDVAVSGGINVAGGRASIGELLRQWRELRRLTQLHLAGQASVSTRHLSYVETGRSQPSREMVLHLAEHLGVPLRQRNELLLAAGYAPVYTEMSLKAPGMAHISEALERVLAGHDPYPALVVDRDWNLVSGNASLRLFTDMVAPELLRPPVNVLQLALHPQGMAPHIVNLAEWRGHILAGLRPRLDSSGRPGPLAALYEELCSYPGGEPASLARPTDVVIPLRLRDHEAGEIALFATIATFGAPLDITVAELAIETFFPADDHTAEILRDRYGPR